MSIIDTIYFGNYNTDIFFSELKIENNWKNSLFISDENILQKNSFLNDFWSSLDSRQKLLIPPGEEAKNKETLFKILDAAFELKMDRHSTMVAIGGGVLTDLTGFAASLFKRGCQVVFYPTTLLAMVDAAVGGKTGIDYRGLKNMVGTFYPASEVRIDLRFLQALPEDEYRSGLGEVIKTAMLGDRELFEKLRKESEGFLMRDKALLKEAVASCVKVKARFVREDLYERGQRAFLNWGHTFAHAFEAVCGLGSFTHGEAVVWGIDKGLKAAALVDKGNEEYSEAFEDLVNRYGFSVETPIGDFELFWEALLQDKKSANGELEFVLQSGLGETFRLPLSKSIVQQVVAVL